MLSLSNSKFPEVEVGTNVAVRVPDVDRERAAPRNVLAVIMEVNSSGPVSYTHLTLPTIYSV